MRRDFTVDETGAGRILRAWLAERLPEVPTKGVRRAIQRGQVTVDGERVSSSITLQTGQTVSVHIQDIFRSTAKGPDLEVLYEDDDLAAIFKPEGIEIHGNHNAQFMGAVKRVLQPSQASDATLNPVILHRLDKPTCGILLVAKTRRAIKSLSDQFQDRTIHKQYLAVVYGKLIKESTVNSIIDGKEAVSFISGNPKWPTTIIENATIVNVSPKTGRKHQIRRHLSSLNLPIVGDKTYGIPNDNYEHLLLCAEAIRFKHPDGSIKELQCQVPAYFGLSGRSE